MNELNILTLLTPKKELALLDDSMNIRQALEKMKAHSFMAVPLINKKSGEYLGTITEGDLLWNIMDNDFEVDNTKVKKWIRKDYSKAAKIDTKFEDLIKMITNQNFVPVVDDRNILMGIITRRKIINELIENNKNNGRIEE